LWNKFYEKCEALFHSTNTNVASLHDDLAQLASSALPDVPARGQAIQRQSMLMPLWRALEGASLLRTFSEQGFNIPCRVSEHGSMQIELLRLAQK